MESAADANVCVWEGREVRGVGGEGRYVLKCLG